MRAFSCENGYKHLLTIEKRPAEIFCYTEKTLLEQGISLTRHIRIQEPDSGLNARVLLLDDKAPRSSEALWQIAGAGGAHEAIHAMWTGPEISCPIPAANLPAQIGLSDLSLENATSYPEEGDIVVVYAPANTWKGQPPFAFLDVGVFYGRGARLLMPMGWVQGSVCGVILSEELPAARTACQSVRRRGACRLSFQRDP